MLGRRQVSLLEFELLSKSYPGTRRRGQPTRGGASERTLRGTLASLERFGYSCFWQFPTSLVPASGPCWRERFGRRLRWSNMLCAHEPAVLAKLENISIEGHALRQRAAAPAPRRLAVEPIAGEPLRMP